MSTGIDDGGPAFPTGTQVSQNSATGETTVHQYLSDGVSMRDYFAAKAMSGMWASDQPGWECTGKDDALDARAQTAYRQADAMLRARKA